MYNRLFKKIKVEVGELEIETNCSRCLAVSCIKLYQILKPFKGEGCQFLDRGVKQVTCRI